MAKGAGANDENPESAFLYQSADVGSGKAISAASSCGTWRLIPAFLAEKACPVRPRPVRNLLTWTIIGSLFIAKTVSSFGPGMVIHAADDAHAIAQAEIVRGSYAAELLDVEGLRIVKYLPGNGECHRRRLSNAPWDCGRRD